jgi:hypothetical protein
MKTSRNALAVLMSVPAVLVAFVYYANAANAETRKIPYNPNYHPNQMVRGRRCLPAPQYNQFGRYCWATKCISPGGHGCCYQWSCTTVH